MEIEHTPLSVHINNGIIGKKPNSKLRLVYSVQSKLRSDNQNSDQDNQNSDQDNQNSDQDNQNSDQDNQNTHAQYVKKGVLSTPYRVPQP